jgi:hypothetical protein
MGLVVAVSSPGDVKNEKRRHFLRWHIKERETRKMKRLIQSSEKRCQLINRTHISPEVSVMCAALVCNPVNGRP